ncbi:MAG: SRPBCC family protein [Allosphingosinicella sp.]
MSDYGVVTEAGAVRFERLLPAPVERVWDYLVDSALRDKWFAAGDMELRPGGRIELVFHNDRLSPHEEEIPEKYRAYEAYRSGGEIVRVEPPRLLVFLWFEESGPPNEVSWELAPRGDQTLMILTHSRLPNRAMMVDVSGGWHLHLEVLEAVLAGRAPGPFWSRNAELEREYQARIPADAIGIA